MLYVLSAWRFTCCRRVRAFTLVVVVGVEWLVVDDFAGLGEDGDRVAVDDHGLHLVYVQCFLSSLGGIFPQLGLLVFRSVGSVCGPVA